jgi:hypothetical protein
MLKSNQLILGRVLKVAIVSVAAVMLAVALRKFFSDADSVNRLIILVREHQLWLAIILLLLPLNWFLETAKWKKLVSISEEISWKQAWSGVLAGLAIGSATPNRIGEFTGRIFQLKATPLRDGIVFTMVSAFMQVAVTVGFGLLGVLMTDPDQYLHSRKAFLWMILVTGGACIAIAVLKSARGKIAEYFSAMRKVDGNVQRYVLGVSALRYMVYSLQFFLMLKICGVEAGSMDMIWAIAVNYLVVTIIPSVMISELLVRGTVASGVIGSLCGNPGAAALAAVLLWMINVGLPALCGLFFIRNLSFFKAKP